MSLCLFITRADSGLRHALKAAISPSFAATQIGGSPCVGWSVLTKNEGFVELRLRLGDSLDRSEPEPASSSPVRRESFLGGEFTFLIGGGPKSSSSSSISGGRRQVSMPELRAAAFLDGEAGGDAGGGDCDGAGALEGGGEVCLVSVSTSIQDNCAMAMSETSAVIKSPPVVL